MLAVRAVPLEVRLRAGAVRLRQFAVSVFNGWRGEAMAFADRWRRFRRWLTQGPPCPRCGDGRCDYRPAEHLSLPRCRLFEWFMGVR